MKEKSKNRDFNIKLSYQKIIDLNTKVLKDKSKYTRKIKHKK